METCLSSKGLDLQVTGSIALHEPPLQNPEFLGQTADEAFRDGSALLKVFRFEKYSKCSLCSSLSASRAQGTLRWGPDSKPMAKPRRTA